MEEEISREKLKIPFEHFNFRIFQRLLAKISLDLDFIFIFYSIILYHSNQLLI